MRGCVNTQPYKGSASFNYFDLEIDAALISPDCTSAITFPDVSNGDPVSVQ